MSCHKLFIWVPGPWPSTYPPPSFLPLSDPICIIRWHQNLKCWWGIYVIMFLLSAFWLSLLEGSQPASTTWISCSRFSSFSVILWAHACGWLLVTWKSTNPCRHIFHSTQHADKVLLHENQRKEIRDHIKAPSLEKLKLDDEKTIGYMNAHCIWTSRLWSYICSCLAEDKSLTHTLVHTYPYTSYPLGVVATTLRCVVHWEAIMGIK